MNHQTKYFFIPLAIFTLVFCSSNNAMFQQTARKIIQGQEEEKKHKEKLKKIKKLNTITAVNHEINILKNDIYKESLEELEYITHKSYDHLKNYFNEKRTIIKILLQEENSLITQKHDENIPPYMYKDIISILQKNNIDPKNITLKYKINDDTNPFSLATSKGINLYFLDHPPYYKKPRIRIYSALTKLSKIKQLFGYTHELFHILLGHNFMRAMARSYDSNINQLVSITEREADIHAASTDIQLAFAGMQSHCNYFNNSTVGNAAILSKESHCREMQIMYALMERKKELLNNQNI